MMKRIFTLILALVLAALPLASCGRASGDGDRLTVVTTVFPCYDLVREIAGDRATVKMLLSPESESHTYEPSMADLALISEADIFVYTEGEEWVKDLEATLSEADTYFICAFEEHGWTSVNATRLAARFIAQELTALDPKAEDDFYRNRAYAYEGKLNGLMVELGALMLEATVPEVIIADRFPFEPLFSEYGIPYTAALDGCGVGEEPSASVIAEIIEKITSKGIEYIFVIEQSDAKTAKLISEATGAKMLTLHSCHNVTAEELAGDVSYLDLMKQNIDNLRLALGCPEAPSEMDTEKVN